MDNVFGFLSFSGNNPKYKARIELILYGLFLIVVNYQLLVATCPDYSVITRYPFI